MERYSILIFTYFGLCLSEWVLIPPISLKKTAFDNEFLYGFEENITRQKEEICPDFHNLTTMSFGTLFKKEPESRTGWDISFEDVEEILKENENIPHSSDGKVVMVKAMEENLMSEAEDQLKSLFSSERGARTKDFYHPTMESALMTIAMLLFGVYLSKLILKLLQSHYNRYNGGVAMMTGIRAPVKFTHGRSKKSIQLQHINLRHLIDKYNSMYN